MTMPVPDDAEPLPVRLPLAALAQAPRVPLPTEGGGSWWNSGPCTGPDDPPGPDDSHSGSAGPSCEAEADEAEADEADRD